MSGALTPGCENIDVESAILEGSIEGRSANVLDKFIVILYRICKGKYIPAAAQRSSSSNYFHKILCIKRVFSIKLENYST